MNRHQCDWGVMKILCDSVQEKQTTIRQRKKAGGVPFLRAVGGHSWICRSWWWWKDLLFCIFLLQIFSFIGTAMWWFLCLYGHSLWVRLNQRKQSITLLLLLLLLLGLYHVIRGWPKWIFWKRKMGLASIVVVVHDPTFLPWLHFNSVCKSSDSSVLVSFVGEVPKREERQFLSFFTWWTKPELKLFLLWRSMAVLLAPLYKPLSVFRYQIQ